MTVMDRLERCSSFECLAMILAAMPSYPIASAYRSHTQGVTAFGGGGGGGGGVGRGGNALETQGFEYPEGGARKRAPRIVACTAA